MPRHITELRLASEYRRSGDAALLCKDALAEVGKFIRQYGSML
jgi:hypothetical protein